MRRIILMLVLLAASVPAICAGHTLVVSGNRIVLDRHKVELLYRSSGDLDGDGKAETVFSIEQWSAMDFPKAVFVVARAQRGKWHVIASDEYGECDLRADVTDVNGDHRAEIVARSTSGDGHGIAEILALRRGKLVTLGGFGLTRLRDLNGDGIPEVLSLEWTVFGFVGDHWLTIHKWNGEGYTDVSARFPKQYGPVIKDLRREIYLLRYTHYHGSRSDPSHDPELFSGMYYYLGLAYEYHREPAKAKMQYAIAYRLKPDDEDVQRAFRRTWHIKPK